MMQEEIEKRIKQAKVDWGSKDTFTPENDFNDFFERRSPRWIKSRYDWEKLCIWIGITALCLASWFYIIKGALWLIYQLL